MISMKKISIVYIQKIFFNLKYVYNLKYFSFQIIMVGSFCDKY